MSAEPDASQLVRELWDHPHTGSLSNAVRLWANSLWQVRRSAPLAGLAQPGTPLSETQADTPYGNLSEVLARGPQSDRERALLGALLALALRERPPASDAEAREIGTALVWLATRAACDALSALDTALGEHAAGIWQGVASVLLEPDAVPDFSLGEALVAAAALARSESAEARRLRLEARALPLDPAVQTVLAPIESYDDELRGELAVARSPWLTVLLTVTSILFLGALVRLFARYALSYRRPATLRLGPQGLELSSQTILLGRVLRNRSLRIPLSGIASMTREVRYSGAGLYAGLFALAVGTYYGTGRFVEWLRVREADLFVVAVLAVLLGLSLDFLLTSVAHSARGRCRVVVAPLRGRSVCVGSLDAERTDALLAAVAAQTRRSIPPPSSSSPAAPATA